MLQEMIRRLTSSSEVTVWLTAGGVALAAAFYWTRRRRYNLPPGPRPLPLLGNVLQLNTERGMHNVFLEWAKIYGQMFTFWQFRTPVVVINDKDLIREALITRSVEFADRPQTFSLQYISRGGKIIGLGPFTDSWKHQKKLATMALKMYGDGLQRLEDISQEVLEDFYAHLQSYEGEAINIGQESRKAIINVITSMILGYKFAWDDPDFALLEEGLAGIPGLQPSRIIVDAAPWMRHLVPLNAFQRLQRTKELFDEFFDRHLLNIQKNYDPNDVKCFAESMYANYLLEREQESPIMDYEMFIMTIFGIFIAGFATTSIAMTSCILILMSKPEVEKKLMAEIDNVLGKDRLPSLKDKANMPYANALILELLRYITHVPTALPHATTTDVEIGGYSIPKGTMVMMNLYKMHHDETLWDKPWEFRPERFLDPATGEVVPPGDKARQSLMTFGAGRRVCIGEALAKNRLFLFLVGLFQKFQFLPAEGATLPSCDSRTWKFNFVMENPSFKVRLVPRS